MVALEQQVFSFESPLNFTTLYHPKPDVPTINEDLRLMAKKVFY
jgi:hypothetical protein